MSKNVGSLVLGTIKSKKFNNIIVNIIKFLLLQITDNIKHHNLYINNFDHQQNISICDRLKKTKLFNRKIKTYMVRISIPK